MSTRARVAFPLGLDPILVERCDSLQIASHSVV